MEPPADGARAELVLVRGDVEASLGRLVAPELDLSVVDAVARLQLEATRRGCVVRLRWTCPHLVELLELAGLGDLVDTVRRW